MPKQEPRKGLVRIVLIEDHILLREVLARTLSMEPDFEIAGECSTVDEGVEMVIRNPTDIVLLDINLGSEQGGAFLNRAKAAGYHGKVLVVTAGLSEREAAWLLQRGCSGIFLKAESMATLIEQIRGIVNGTSKLDAISVKAVFSQIEAGIPPRKTLTRREGEVLRGLCEGLTNKEIGERLGVSENSVKSFVQQLFQKTGVRTRAGLVAVAIEEYWDQLDQA